MCTSGASQVHRVRARRCVPGARVYLIFPRPRGVIAGEPRLVYGLPLHSSPGAECPDHSGRAALRPRTAPPRYRATVVAAGMPLPCAGQNGVCAARTAQPGPLHDGRDFGDGMRGAACWARIARVAAARARQGDETVQ